MRALRWLSAWLFPVRSWRVGTGRLAKVSPRRQLLFWVIACFLPLAVLGAIQLAWIGHVNESQRQSARSSLSDSLRLVADQLRYESMLLLATFSPDADLEPSRRLERYHERYLLWNELSLFGLAVQRVLFLDWTPSGGETLTELDSESRRIVPVTWDSRLEPVRSEIAARGFSPGRSTNSRWAATWMYHPRSAALFRLLPGVAPSPVVGETPAMFAGGYLILQLDTQAIRDRVIPDVLSDQFIAPAIDGQYNVSITVDGETLYAYEPVVDAGEAATEVSGYALRQPHQPGGSDGRYRLLLRPGPVPNAVRRRGGVQRVSLRDFGRTSGMQMPVPIPVEGSERSAAAAMADPQVELWASPPRLFLIAGAQRSMAIEARHVEGPLEEILSRHHKQTLAIGMGLLILLAGVVGIFIATGRSAAKLAEARMEAATSQSHQLRTPIAAILVLSDNMARGTAATRDKVMEYGSLIREYGHQLSQIVDQAMQLSAVDSFEAHQELTRIDVAKVTENALLEARPLIDGAGFTVECPSANGLPEVQADREALRQSVVELLSNAVKYGLPGRWVKLETTEATLGQKREVRIQVHDRGPGISHTERLKIFDPYYRLPRDASSSIPGTGLGLKLVQHRVRAMGGDVSVESEVGRGSVFTIHLPVIV